MRTRWLGLPLLACCTTVTPSAVDSAQPPTPVLDTAPQDVVSGVIETADGRPAAGVWVALNAPGGERLALASSDDAGRFRLPRPGGTFALTATAEQGTGIFMPASALETTAAERIEIQLGPVDAGTTIHGTMSLQGGPPPSPLLVAAARLSDDEGDIFFTTVSNDGRFSLSLPPGTYFLGSGSAEVLAPSVRVSGTAGDRLEVLLPSSLRAPAPEEVVAWLAEHAIPLTTADADGPLDDLAPLQSALGTARIIGVGEATHGTSEFFTLKHRLLRRLVEKHGVTVLAMEANVADAERVDEYVRTGRGTADEAIGHLFLVWQTQEVRDLLAWMRAYNADPKHRRKLRFAGYDVQDARLPIDRVRKYLRKVAPAREALLDPLAALEARPNTRGMVELTPEQRTETEAAAARLVQAFSDHEKAFIARSTPPEYAIARHYAELVAQAQARYAAQTPNEQFTQRDRSMAANVAWLAERAGPDERIMVWAHNGHIRLDSEGLLGRNMGSQLRERFGDDYLSIGFVLNRGEYRAASDPSRPRDTVLVPLDSSAPGHLAEAFSRVDAPIFAVDLRGAPQGVVGNWLTAPHIVHSCGWVVSEYERQGTLGSITKRFDLVLYLDRTTGATPLPHHPPP